ncbi:hypothetical protein APHWI1_0114 [Anaplasma phagocytophilum str. ApWI1]|uniref:Uncharacterized protein n=1 Tax=Anaplasma phagocytophilum str. ApWI1 TaxID=1359155 RepID=A0A0F3PXC2_ANAPH|nr:hypothetical protein APHHGE2_0912 [Anaplasma phagocytophilum str. HGE2]KJV84637.1 hypothetical protein APHWI1_0114 [Anaplasma phagocytophilum str. ApWI1]
MFHLVWDEIRPVLCIMLSRCGQVRCMGRPFCMIFFRAVASLQ